MHVGCCQHGPFFLMKGRGREKGRERGRREEEEEEEEEKEEKEEKEKEVGCTVQFGFLYLEFYSHFRPIFKISAV
jgi:hypothetical protein